MQETRPCVLDDTLYTVAVTRLCTMTAECFDPDVWRLSTSVDVYSLAIIMSEMLMRRPPWHGMSSMQVAWEVHVQVRPWFREPQKEHFGGLCVSILFAY